VLVAGTRGSSARSGGDEATVRLDSRRREPQARALSSVDEDERGGGGAPGDEDNTRSGEDE